MCCRASRMTIDASRSLIKKGVTGFDGEPTPLSHVELSGLVNPEISRQSIAA